MQAPRQSLRVLLVEDSLDDADLILLALNEGGLDAVCTRVDAEAAMRAEMAGSDWDVVLSDFNLPRFSARNALAVLREMDADIPFIIVSGCIGEENAIALMKEGASDFVMKDKLARLAPAIERELREADTRRERRQALEALYLNEKLLNGITSSLGEGIYVLDQEGRLVFMNPEAERLLGWTEAELLGQKVHGIIHGQKPDGTPLAEAECGVLRALSHGNAHKSEEDVFVCKDGSHIPVSITASAIVEDGKAIAAVTAFQDISQRKKAERDLLESREQLRELTSHLHAVREEERTRIARELHDELGQMLTGVKLDAKWLAAHLPVQQPEVMNKMSSMLKLIDETLDAMRRVAADLRPVMLDDLGLVAAVEWLTEEFNRRTGIDIKLEMNIEQGGCDCQGGEGDLDAEVATAAFRIVQECLTNIARHAEAGHVRVSLKCKNDMLLLQVSDDGKGVSEPGEVKRKSYGIAGMRERATGLGGTLDFSSIPGKGVSVKVALPRKPVILQE